MTNKRDRYFAKKVIEIQKSTRKKRLIYCHHLLEKLKSKNYRIPQYVKVHTFLHEAAITVRFWGLENQTTGPVQIQLEA